MPARAATAASTESSDPVAEGRMSEEDYALEQARTSGERYELLSARTEASDTWALPDGTWSVSQHSTPVRMLRDGSWAATDPTLVFAANGRVSPKASTVAVSFSGGGTGPMLTGVKDGRTLSLTWPTALPKPTLDGNVATYADLLPGVDLQLKSEVEGFSQLLVVKTAEAAKNPALATLSYKLDTVGVNVSTDTETGSVQATNPAGQMVFTSPSPLMWDSTTITSADDVPPGTAGVTGKALSAGEGEAPADQFVPPPGAQDAQMPTTVSGDTLSISPDQALLTGADTQYPVFIDPSWAWGDRQHWTRVYKAYPKNSYWDSKDVLRVGYEAETGGSNRVSRSLFQVGLDDVTSAAKADKLKISSATFRIKNSWSWSCRNRPVQLRQLSSGITRKTTWNNQPSKDKSVLLDTVDDAKGWGKDCAAGNLEFDATKAVAASVGKASMTLGLYASNESDTYSWKKFDPKSFTLEIRYKRVPRTPDKLGTSPATSCDKGGLIGNTKVNLYARARDGDGGNLTARFQVMKSGSSTPLVDSSIPAPNGKVSTLSVPDADLPTGSYTWRVLAKDGDNLTSPWSKTCKFTVDRTRPVNPPKITSQDGVFPPGESGWPAQTGQARHAGRFAFAPNGVTDVDHYAWWTDTSPDLNSAKPGVPATVTPPGYGPHFVYAYSVDKAGNRSDTATYLYYATRSQERDGPDDLNGDGNRDIWSIDSNGTLLTYAGQGDGSFAAATNGSGESFDGSQVTSRGDWGQDGYNDLIALTSVASDSNKNHLRSYANNGTGVIGDDVDELNVICPVADPDYGCDQGDDHWYNAEQILAPGDMNNDGFSDLLVKQGKSLWAYYGNRTLRLDRIREPVLVGTTDWSQYTVIAPGDLNGDSIPDLWLRQNTTGDLYRALGEKGADGYLDPTTWGTAQLTKIGTGYKASTYPAVGSSGDINGDGLPDLWARKADNTMLGWPGTAANTALGTSYLIEGVTGGTRIPAGTQLKAGQSYTSRSNKLTMRDDGNLTITSRANKVLWQSGTAGHPGATALMQSDGNLTVTASDGTGLLWQAKTSSPGGYALLQDRGNLLIYNAKGQSIWSSGTAVRHDYNNDGRSDLADWYDYADGHDEIHTFAAQSDGTFTDFERGWSAADGNYWAEHMKRTTGDFNGDGIGDIAAFYGYDDGRLAVFTWLGKGDGTFQNRTESWKVAAGQWSFDHIQVQSGDFNGDGRDDLAAWYAYGDGSDRLFTFTSKVNGGFNPPATSFYKASGWYVEHMKFATGDFNGDGRDDLGAFYGYADGHVALFTFTTKPDGGFNEPITGWTSTNWGSFASTSVHSGDFDGDGRDDIATWYDYADGHDTVIGFNPSGSDGKFGSRHDMWTTAAGNFYREHMKVATGDFNGDGRDDIATLYGYDDGHLEAITWTAKIDGTLNEPVHSWNAPTGDWTFNRVYLIERYSPA
ncbi:FG-GAP-like repeat-containing protein [Streptomyces sp. NPDC048680]|uniref:FG-GAP-like repeat-containing protein n=1 Tax=Streptomyces sp. NPDC048680 TaxID=3155492 RepID=UPI00343A5E7B